MGFIEEASGWLHELGTDQWASPWPTRKARDERIRRGLANGVTRLAEDRGVRPVATVTARQHGNPALWGEDERRIPACYASRLVVCRDYAGQQIGTALVDWADLRAYRRYDAHYIRIDVWTTNLGLHSYYEKRGFISAGICNYVDYPSAALFQKPTPEGGRDLVALFRQDRRDDSFGKSLAADTSAWTSARV